MSEIQTQFYSSVEKVKKQLKTQVKISPNKKKAICKIALDLQVRKLICNTKLMSSRMFVGMLIHCKMSKF